MASILAAPCDSPTNSCLCTKSHVPFCTSLSQPPAEGIRLSNGANRNSIYKNDIRHEYDGDDDEGYAVYMCEFLCLVVTCALTRRFAVKKSKRF